MNNKELKGKMVMVPRTMFGREHVAYCMHVDKDYIFCIDWNGNRERLSVSTQGFREATTQEIADAATNDCLLNAQDYEF